MKTKACENCSSLTDGNYGSGRFCSSVCARAYSTKSKRIEINEKVSKKLKGPIKRKKCKQCDSIFIYKKTNEFCSNSCSAIFRTSNEQYIKKLSDAANENVKNGTHVGWQSRKVRSYAEKFFETFLINNNLKFDIEHKIKKTDLGFEDASNYFLDFYLTDFNLDLEIDGKQHEYPERKESDRIRDEALNKFGIKVYRIKWKNPNNELNKEYIKNEINKFLKYIGVWESW